MPKRQIKGTVTSDSMDKTVVISLTVPKRHRVYLKTINVTKKFKARDDMGVKKGDVVVIEEAPTYSKTVTWKVVENLSAKDK